MGKDYEKLLHTFVALRTFLHLSTIGKVCQTFEEPGKGSPALDDLILRCDNFLILVQCKHKVDKYDKLTLAELRSQFSAKDIKKGTCHFVYVHRET